MSQASAFRILRRLGKCFAVLGLAWAAQTASAATYTAADAAALTSLLGSTVYGDTIILNAATTYTAPLGGFVLPAKTGTGYITIQSSNMASLPPAGQRVFPSHAAHMPNIRIANGSDPLTTNGRTFVTAAPPDVSHGWKLIGLELIGPADNIMTKAIIELGRQAVEQNSLSLVPYDFVIDRCYVHPNVNTAHHTRGISLSTKNTEVINSYIEEIHNPGVESHGINITPNGPGPYTIDNNRVEGASINIFFGAGSGFITNTICRDIVVKRNHFIKPLTWQSQSYNAKNHFEVKSGERITFEGNICENSWAQGQDGLSISLKSINNEPWFYTKDVVITKNIVRNCAYGVKMQGFDTSWPGTGRVTNTTINNNLFDTMTAGTSGGLFKGTWAGANTTLDHNTCINNGGSYVVYFGANLTEFWTGFVCKNNLANGGPGGFKGDQSYGDPSISANCPNPVVFQKNVMVGDGAPTLTQWLNMYATFTGGWSPTSLAFPNGWTGVLVDVNNPGTNYAGYKVVNGSAYDNAGTDGKDIGCDIDEVVAATAGCVSGVWSGGGSPVVLEDFANSTDYWGAAYTGVGGDDLITGGKLVVVTHGTSNCLVSCGNYKHSGENIANAGIWTTGDFSGQSRTKLTFTLKNTGAAALTASNFIAANDYVGITLKRISTVGNLQSNRAQWTLANILFNDPGRVSIAAGETITVNVPFNSVDSWWNTTPSNQYGLDPAADRYIYSGFRIAVAAGNGTKNLEIDDVKIE